MSTRRNRSNRRNTRRNRRNGAARRVGLFSKIYSPVSHLLTATGNVAGSVTNTTRNVVKRGLRGVNSVGRSVTGHADSAVRDLVSRKRRGGSRKSRKASRKARKASRKSRKAHRKGSRKAHRKGSRKNRKNSRKNRRN